MPKLYDGLVKCRIWSSIASSLLKNNENIGVLLIFNPRRHIEEAMLVQMLAEYLHKHGFYGNMQMKYVSGVKHMIILPVYGTVTVLFCGKKIVKCRNINRLELSRRISLSFQI